MLGVVPGIIGTLQVGRVLLGFLVDVQGLGMGSSCSEAGVLGVVPGIIGTLQVGRGVLGL